MPKNEGPGKGNVLKAVFLDRDGVINRNIDKGYVTEWRLFEFLPDSLEALAHIKKKGLLAVLITNQSCINRNLVPKENVDDIHKCMLAEIERAGGKLDAVYMCPHRPDEGCACRKPRAELLERAMRDFKLSPDEVLFVGDHERDRGAAEAAHCRYDQVSERRSLFEITKEWLD
ncbi:MAG: HAD-IIIA family hydrolase [Euryarchaeota archaeon]|nr:HAD-IIIA family hydrolase [Euryarchaeota archaeon]